MAREFGVRSGMPSFIGKALCPEMIFIKANYIKYRAISRQIKDILATYDENIEATGLDEASIDVTDYLIKNQMNSEEGRIFIGHKIRREINEATELTASCGIACNKLLAKICSQMKKPNGMTYLDFSVEEIEKFILT